MESLFILIPLALFFLTLVVLIFFWAVKSGQFEDLDTEARRILFEEESVAHKPASYAKASPTLTLSDTPNIARPTDIKEPRS